LNYENGKAATPKYTPPIEVLINASKVLRSGKKEKEVKLDLLPTLAPSSELELRNDKNLTQNLTQTTRRNNKGPTI
jgi:hypothetical protein